MGVVWDPEKARSNPRKHGVRFSDAEPVPFDPNALTMEDITAAGEQRCVTLGVDSVGRVLAVVHTYPEEDARLISARPETRKEGKHHEE